MLFFLVSLGFLGIYNYINAIYKSISQYNIQLHIWDLTEREASLISVQKVLLLGFQWKNTTAVVVIKVSSISGAMCIKLLYYAVYMSSYHSINVRNWEREVLWFFLFAWEWARWDVIVRWRGFELSLGEKKMIMPEKGFTRMQSVFAWCIFRHFTVSQFTNFIGYKHIS